MCAARAEDCNLVQAQDAARASRSFLRMRSEADFSWPQAAKDVAAARRADRRGVAGPVDDVGEFLDAFPVGALIFGARPGIERDQVDLGRNALEQADQVERVLVAVVDTFQHHVFEGDALGVGQARILPAGVQKRF